MTIRNRKMLTGFAAAALIAIAAAPAAADRPNEKGCPGEITWDSFIMNVLALFGVGDHIQDNCL
jgi:hypothetical protein